MKSNRISPIARVIGDIPYRLALAGGWIDQPFVSRRNPRPPGSMVVVGLEPTFRFMDRSGIATGTREVATRVWHGKLPSRAPAELTRELYEIENRGKAEPSGSQDMVGLIYPGINRLDYDFAANGGVFPAHIESVNDRSIIRWLERVIQVLPVAPRPEGYNPLGQKRLEPKWIARLGQTGKDCFEAIRSRDVQSLGASLNECMTCWERLLPNTVRHPTLKVDLMGLLRAYQSCYAGAMYSGCGGGYLLVVSKEAVPGAFTVKVRVTPGAKR
ncbi:MAG: hypothetical protein ACLQU3_06875 [Limisphaerales bacterium]